MSNFEKLQNLLSRQLNLDYKLIKADTCFREELGKEEIELMELKLAIELKFHIIKLENNCLLYTSPSPRDATLSRMPSSA